jgi:hypothetical protein
MISLFRGAFKKSQTMECKRNETHMKKVMVQNDSRGIFVLLAFFIRGERSQRLW